MAGKNHDKKAAKAKGKTKNKRRERANKRRGYSAPTGGYCVTQDTQKRERKYRGPSADTINAHKMTPRLLNANLDYEMTRIGIKSKHAHDYRSIQAGLRHFERDENKPMVEGAERSEAMMDHLENARLSKSQPNKVALFWAAVHAVCKAGLNMADKAQRKQAESRKMALIQYRRDNGLEIPVATK